MKAATTTARIGQPTEKQFQSQVVRLAVLCGWVVFHDYDSRRSTPGFPDIVAVKNGRLVFLELKRSPKARVTDVQREWIAALSAVQGQVVARVVTPDDWPEIQRLLME